VLTLNNTEAVLQSTSEFFVRVAGKDQVDLFNVSLGLMMRVTPTLVDDAQGKRFKLQVRIEDGNTNSGAQVDQIPVVNRNAISTQAVVGDGQSLLIGGYTIEDQRNGKAGVPFLSEVPGLRWLFGQRTTSTKRVERLFMITPRLVSLSSLTSAAPISVQMLGLGKDVSRGEARSENRNESITQLLGDWAADSADSEKRVPRVRGAAESPASVTPRTPSDPSAP
jgi:type III secretion protein C